MGEARRRFLLTIAAAAISCFVTMCGLAQEPKKKDSPAPDPPQPAETPNPAEVAAAAAAAKRGSQISRAALLQNEKDFRARVNRLHQLVSELKEDLDKTPTADVFSLQMYKKTQEIESLAKQLKRKARG
jgi:hypothetical protein